MNTILIVTIKSWNIKNARILKQKLSKKIKVEIITEKDGLTIEKVKKIAPKYIFFPHWSWIVQKEIYENFLCVNFHETDLPFGRGGSPLQNLISRKIYKTKITAHKITKEIDAGDIYLQTGINIKRGSAQELFSKISKIIFFRMITEILEKGLYPEPQKGKIVIFKRRKSEESNLAEFNGKSLNNLYDFIRMLDAEGYPKAFIKLNNMKILCSDVKYAHNSLLGKFEVVKNETN